MKIKMKMAMEMKMKMKMEMKGEIDNHGYNFELLLNFSIRGELISGVVEHSLRISAPQLLRFGINSVLNILNKRMT